MNIFWRSLGLGTFPSVRFHQERVLWNDEDARCTAYPGVSPPREIIQSGCFVLHPGGTAKPAERMYCRVFCVCG